MVLLRGIVRLVGGIARGIFVAPSKVWPVVRWLILLGAAAASLIEDAREWIATHPWEFGLGVLAYGAILYAYDLQARLEGTNSAKVVIGGFEIEFRDRIKYGGKALQKPVFVCVKYVIRNNLGTSIRTTRPEVDLLRGRWWRTEAARYDVANRSWGSEGGAVVGLEEEVPAFSKRSFRASLTVTGVDLRGLSRGEYLVRMSNDVSPLGEQVFLKRIKREDIINYAIPPVVS